MRLIKVGANKQSFRTVNFNARGPSFIVAKQKNPGASDRGKTYNGVGKSLLVRIIHFCLGGQSGYETFCERLPGWEFSLEFLVNSDTYVVRRATNNPSKLTLNNKDLTVAKFNARMGELCFDIPSDSNYISFRSLLPFFIRPRKESYVSYDKPTKTGSEYQAMLYNAFLLGLDVGLAQKKYEIRHEQTRIQKLTQNFQSDSVLREYFSGNKDVSLTLLDLSEQINRLDTDLRHFRVAEDYGRVQSEADEAERNLFTLQNSIILAKNNIENINKSLQLSPDVSKDKLSAIYAEAKIYFSERLKGDLTDLENFHKKLVSNRARRLLQLRNQLNLELKEKSEEIDKLQKRLDGLMRYLGEHQALDVFVSLSNRSADLKAERDSLKKYEELQAEYKRQERKAEKELLELNDVTEGYLKEIESDVVELRHYFRNLAKRCYPDSASGLTILNNDGENQLRYSIEAKIESDASDGINNVKIFCYDLTLLFKGRNHRMGFVFHDSRLYDATDERQKGEMFRIIGDLFSNGNKQYIATVNQNQLNEIKKHLSDIEYESLINKNTILYLTDDNDSEKLLGIKVDIGES